MTNVSETSTQTSPNLSQSKLEESKRQQIESIKNLEKNTRENEEIGDFIVTGNNNKLDLISVQKPEINQIVPIQKIETKLEKIEKDHSRQDFQVNSKKSNEKSKPESIEPKTQKKKLIGSCNKEEEKSSNNQLSPLEKKNIIIGSDPLLIGDFPSLQEIFPQQKLIKVNTICNKDDKMFIEENKTFQP